MVDSVVTFRGPAPPWRVLEVKVDADLSSAIPWPVLHAAGYSSNFKIRAPLDLQSISFSEQPQYVYVTGDEKRSIHVFWFAECGGTAEFDLVDGKLAHLDSYGCDFCISGNELILSPHRGGGDRLRLGPSRNQPRNSEELLLSAFFYNQAGR